MSSQANESGANGDFPPLASEEDELIEQDIRDRFKRMCEGYYESVCKKLIVEHKVSFVSLYVQPEGFEYISASTRTRPSKS